MSSTFFPATRSLYIHWPFCPYKCHFCPFVAIAGQDHYMEQYHRALMEEIQNFAKSGSSKLALDTIFLGGGTPSTWPESLLLDTFGTLRKKFNIEDNCEITIEVNPGTVRESHLVTWKAAGINRLSVGVQGLKDSVLNNLNRKQTKDDVLWLVQRASKDFQNISIDLILGLPGVSAQEWKELLAIVVAWPITHISIYFLTVHEETALFFRVKRNEIKLVEDDAMVELYEWTIEFLKEHGIEQYEVSNFAKKGFRSAHNSIYWDRKPYKGLGLGACSFDGRSRFTNQKNLMKYITAIEAGEDITVFSEDLTDKQIMLERTMLGLRRAEGISLHDLFEGLPLEQKKIMEHSLQLLQEHKFLQVKEDRVVLTVAGLAVQNDIAARLSI